MTDKPPRPREWKLGTNSDGMIVGYDGPEISIGPDSDIRVIEKSAYLALEKERDELKETLKEFIMDFLGQGCGIYNREKDRMEYDHMCLSTYEDGIQFALENGWITKDQVLR